MGSFIISNYKSLEIVHLTAWTISYIGIIADNLKTVILFF
jgi:hypothetical protein